MLFAAISPERQSEEVRLYFSPDDAQAEAGEDQRIYKVTVHYDGQLRRLTALGHLYQGIDPGGRQPPSIGSMGSSSPWDQFRCRCLSSGRLGINRLLGEKGGRLPSSSPPRETPAMQISLLRGIIDRCILVNYRVGPTVLARPQPEPFRPKHIHRAGLVPGQPLDPLGLEPLDPAVDGPGATEQQRTDGRPGVAVIQEQEDVGTSDVMESAKPPW